MLLRDFVVHERRELLQMDAFNFRHHAEFRSPDAMVNKTFLFGEIISAAANQQRVLQMTVKYHFQENGRRHAGI